MDVVTALTRVALVIIAGAVCVLPAHGTLNDVAGSASTSTTLDELSTGLNAVMEQGEKTGDYVLVKAVVKARHALDAWRAAYKGVLDKPFGNLDGVVREDLGRTRALIGEANEGARNPVEIAQQLTEHASRILDTRPGPERQVHVLGYAPRIVPPRTTGTLTVRIRGLNLDKADPVLHLPGGPAQPLVVGPHEAQFSLPVDLIASHPSKLRVHTLTVAYTTPAEGFMAWLFRRREFMTRQLSIVSLPSQVATFELSGTRGSDRRREMQFTAEPVQFRGTREHVVKVIAPPPGSRDGKVTWKWDLSKDLRLVQSRGMQGRCERIDLDRSSETGVTVVARVEGEGKTRKRRGAPGWVDCTLVGTVYRLEETAVPIDKQTFTLTWMKDESVALPPDAHEAELMATTFDGRIVRFSDSDDDKFFEVRREANRFLIVPKVPEDVLAGD